jgi:hypothetical protein
MRDDLEEILEKAPKQASVSTQGNIRKVLVEALKTFPDAQNVGQAYHRALWHWYHARQENSKWGGLSRLEENDKEILGRLAALESEIQSLRAEILGAGTSITPPVKD